MIKLIREGSVNHPWILKIVMSVIAVTFVIGMGWFGYGASQQPNIVAVIGAYEVEAREFRRAYNNTYEFYTQQLKREVVAEDLKQEVINTLVGRKLWLIAADDFELDVHPDELRQALMAREEFQQNGVFDPAFYHRLLAQNRIAPKQFEGQIIQSLRTQKIQAIVQDTASLNPADLKELDALIARQTASMEDDTEIQDTKARIRRQLLTQKQQRALQAFQAALSTVSPIEIRNEFL